MTVLAASAATAVAGCGTTHAAAARTAAAARSTGTPSPVTRPAGTPRQRAVADAAAILASFVPPPGARRLPAAPGADEGALKSASSIPGASTLVDDVSWWRVPGQPKAVLAWEKARLSRRFALVSTGYGYAGSVGFNWSDTFSLPPVASVLNTRTVFRARAGGPALAVVSDGGGCDIVLFSIGGRQQPALAGMASLTSGVLRIAGLHWKIH